MNIKFFTLFLSVVATMSSCKSDEEATPANPDLYFFTKEYHTYDSYLYHLNSNGKIDRIANFDFIPKDGFITGGFYYGLARSAFKPSTILKVNLQTGQTTESTFKGSLFCCNENIITKANDKIVTAEYGWPETDFHPIIRVIDFNTLQEEDSIVVNELPDYVVDVEVIDDRLFLASNNWIVAYNTTTWQSEKWGDFTDYYIKDLFTDGKNNLWAISGDNMLLINQQEFAVDDEFAIFSESYKRNSVTVNKLKGDLYGFRPLAQPSLHPNVLLKVQISSEQVTTSSVYPRGGSIFFDEESQKLLIGGMELNYSDNPGGDPPANGVIEIYDENLNFIQEIEIEKNTGEVRFIREF